MTPNIVLYINYQLADKGVCAFRFINHIKCHASKNTSHISQKLVICQMLHLAKVVWSLKFKIFHNAIHIINLYTEGSMLRPLVCRTHVGQLSRNGRTVPYGLVCRTFTTCYLCLFILKWPLIGWCHVSASATHTHVKVNWQAFNTSEVMVSKLHQIYTLPEGQTSNIQCKIWACQAHHQAEASFEHWHQNVV